MDVAMGIILGRTSSAVLVSFFNLFFQIYDLSINFLCGRHKCAGEKKVGC
jgi:hypothetical protein